MKSELMSIVVMCSDIREKMRMETEMEGLKSDVTVLNGKLRDADSRNKQCEAELIDYKMKVERMETQIKQLKVLLISDFD